MNDFIGQSSQGTNISKAYLFPQDLCFLKILAGKYKKKRVDLLAESERGSETSRDKFCTLQMKQLFGCIGDYQDLNFLSKFDFQFFQ